MARPSKPWYWQERGRWVVTFKGKRRTLARGPEAKTKKEAEKEFHRLMLAEGEKGTTSSTITVKELFNLFMAEVERAVAAEELSPRTFLDYNRGLKRCGPALARLTVSEVRPLHVTRWLKGKTWGPTMRNNALSILTIVFRWGKRQGYYDHNPLADLPKPRAKRREAIPSAELAERAIVAAKEIEEGFHDFLLALRETGCRPSEVTSVTAAGVDLEAETWTVKNKTRGTTGEKTRTVYLSPRMVDLSRGLCEAWPTGPIFRNRWGRRWVGTSLSHKFQKLRVTLGCGPELTSYGFRHLFITDALEKGIPPATVAELVGHTDLKMIMRIYNKLRERTGHLREAVRAIRPEPAQSSGK